MFLLILLFSEMLYMETLWFTVRLAFVREYSGPAGTHCYNYTNPAQSG